MTSKKHAGWIHDITELDVSPSQALFPDVQIPKHDPLVCSKKQHFPIHFPPEHEIISVNTAVNYVPEQRPMWQLAELVPGHTVSFLE